MAPPLWRDGSGNLRPVYPCPRCGRDVPIYDDFRLVDLKRLGWSLFIPATYVNWCETGMRYSEIMDMEWERVDLSRGVIRLERTKSGRRREVPMRQVVYNMLAELPGPREGRVWPDESIRTAWETAVERARLDDWRFHDCRHHFASWFMMRGGNLLAPSKILGHAKVSMTEKYAHLAPDHLRNEIARTERPGSGCGTSCWNHEVDS